MSGAPPWPARHEALVDLFGHEPVRDFAEKLHVEPVEQAARLDAAERIVGQQAPVAEREPAGLVEIFGDDARARRDGARLVDEHGRLAGRVQGQEFGPALEGALLDERGFDAEFGEDEPCEARMGADGMVVEDGHALGVTRSVRRVGLAARPGIGERDGRANPRSQTPIGAGAGGVLSG